MDYYSEYNRIRRNLLQQARRHGIKVVNIPTARQLLLETGKKKVNKSQLKTLTTQKKSLQAIIRTKPNKTNKISVQTLRTPSIKNKKSESPKRKSKKPNKIIDYDAIGKKHQTKYTKVTNEGLVIDKYTGETIGYAAFTDSSTIGEYLYKHYGDVDTGEIKLPKEYRNSDFTDIYELQYFKDFIKSKLQIATDDLNDSSKHASIQGIHEVSLAFERFSNAAWKTANEKYKKLGDVVKTYLDDALYYTGNNENHYRAIKLICDIFEVDVSEFYDEIVDEYEDTSFSEDIISEMDEQRVRGERFTLGIPGNW